ncbi:8-oxo-dGTP diphosphatase [Colwellia chukchiensis]|uniref:8-oxo-dGTP diphosphatase n=2 Tax=Colwellia chukchiensis TaxID=641665 RepID=A0A1H7QRX2_9GAMM|nr:8-oxo-dGTP diphosphatase [Colwellia chukchiensis]
MLQKYVTGFLFSADASHLVLIKKINPSWQRGLFNGIGGKIETEESSVAAMVRECKEETGVVTSPKVWTQFADIYRPNAYQVDMYFARTDLAYQAKTQEAETIHLFKVAQLPQQLLPNLRWLIPLALDQQADFSQIIRIQEIAQPRIKA